MFFKGGLSVYHMLTLSLLMIFAKNDLAMFFMVISYGDEHAGFIRLILDGII